MFCTQELTKEFSSRAVDAVSIEFQRGQLHALLGANGAGKSTLCRMIAGMQSPTSGTMQLDGVAYSPSTRREAKRLGVQMVQQELNLISTLSVAENLFLQELPNRLGVLDRKELTRRAERLLADFGLDGISPDTLVAELGIGQQQMLEIIANTKGSPKLLILDEPTAALSVRESQLLFEKIKRWKEAGSAIVYVSHRLAEVEALADRISILRDGKRVGTWNQGELTQKEMVLQMTAAAEDLCHQSEGKQSTSIKCSGSEIDGSEPSTEPVLVVEKLDAPPKVRSVSLSVSRGEVLGVAGLVGSGRTELLRLIFGADRARGGSVWVEDASGVDGKQRLSSRAMFRSPREAVCSGVVMVSEDRKSDGLLLDQSIAMNIQLPQFVQGWFSIFHHYLPERASQVANRYIKQLSIRSESCEQSVGSLSGGNQQKVVLAKWLERSGKVFLLDEPTRGIDSAAREMVYRVIRQLASEGKGVLVVSSDLEELIEISDRIVVLSNGRLTEEFAGPLYDKPAIVAAMFSGYNPGS